MANIYGIELDNPTANTVAVNLFQLGASDSTKITNSILAESVTTTMTPIPFSDAGASATTPFYFIGDTTEISANPSVFYKVNPSEVKLSIATLTSNGGLRQVEFYSGATVTLPQTTSFNLVDLSSEVETYFFGLNSGITCTVNAIPMIQFDGIFRMNLYFQIVYNGNKQLVLSSNQLFNIVTQTALTSFTYSFPDNVGYTTIWRPIYSTIEGVLVDGSTGTDYGEFLQSLVGEPSAINSLRITPLESSTFNENERISQLLESIKFTRVNADGKSKTYVLNPTVDLYQNMTTLDYVNLGSETDNFPLDGNTIFAYQLLPFAKVNIQLDYVQTSNFVFANKELIKEIVELNRKKNKEVQERSRIARQYEL